MLIDSGPSFYGVPVPSSGIPALENLVYEICNIITRFIYAIVYRILVYLVIYMNEDMRSKSRF